MMYISFQRGVHLEIMYILSRMVQLTHTCMPDLHYGKHLAGSTFKIIEKSSLFSCAAECVSYGICKSFNFEVVRRACHLNGLDNVHSLEVGDPDFIYSLILNWNKTVLGPCHDTRCGYTQRCNTKRNGIVLCEQFLPNIAKSKSASSSSRYTPQPSVAVDGDVQAKWSSGSCFHVAYGDFSPWWQVDLLDTYIVVEVRVTSRQDCCPERLHDFSLDLYHDDPLHYLSAIPQLCYMYNGAVTVPGKNVVIQCTSRVTGRYLRLSGKKTKDRQDVLQFCEVQVFGYKVIPW
ncbi:fucolectin-like [Haliotis cracherodii]|uniref:fucolectin-like n=1 Tax=Haliotis cracherodii TaxID=6455 RepID=UPI0039EB213D